MLLGGVSADVELLLTTVGALPLLGAFSLYIVGVWSFPNARIVEGIDAIESKQRSATLGPSIRGGATNVIERPGLYSFNSARSSMTVVRWDRYMTRFAERICSWFSCRFWWEIFMPSLLIPAIPSSIVLSAMSPACHSPHC